MKKVTIFGAKGMLGYATTRYFLSRDYDVKPVSRAEYDIGKDPFDKVAALVEKSNFVINCAGVIKPRIVENTIEETLRINAIFPRNLANLTSQLNIPCFHITTDCVYSGLKGGYNENDTFDATDVYGMTKNAGENKDCMVLRTSIIGEETGQSRSLLEWVRSNKGKEVNGFLNHKWNGVTTLHLAQVIEKIYTDGAYKKGLFHFFSPETLDKQQLVSLISKVYDLGLTVKPTNAGEACDRSMSSIYDLSAKYFNKSLEVQLSEMRDFFKA